MYKLKKRWDISSNTQLILIILVFAINGSLSGIITRPILYLLGINKNNFHQIIYLFTYLLVMTIVYFSILILVSRIFRQEVFFKKFAKKSLGPLGFKRLFD